MKQNMGLKEMNGVFADVTPEQRVQLMSTIMKDLKQAIDNLHNVKGHLSKIIELERDRKDFDDTLFLSNLNKILGRLSTAGEWSVISKIGDFIRVDIAPKRC